jgi:hypothetical protein
VPLSKPNIAFEDRPRRPVTFENVRTLFRNLKGEQNAYNAPGKRNFSILIDPADVEDLVRQGWSVRELKVRDIEGAEQEYALKVNVNYDGRVPPRIVLITGNKRTELTEGSVGELDYAEFKHCDLTVRPYNWEKGNDQGTSAYLKTMYVEIVQDPLDEKYSHVPDAAGAPEPDED